ncbi:substrate-binding domain-containing protein [Halarcobacter sp.]|uniref:substrate-binding domain-containing protein n=1 Tax=Halarcobacter sp. TaxID=2321133 RepID=UPI002AA90E5D|nr:substrate-binding domain-containing protein [Halarcobacter sp.]
MFNKIILSLLLTFIFSINLYANKPILILYSGVTMVKPMKEIAKIIEEKYNCIIKVSQGSSKDLYESLKYSQKGDLYLPGSASYRINNLKDGYLLEGVEIGFNQAAIFVRKGNPLNIKSLDSFVNKNIKTILCNPEAGSIGRETKKIFLKYKDKSFLNKAYDNSIFIGTDSRNLNRALIENEANLTINWRATAFWNENSKYIDIVPLPEKLASKKKLIISLLKFSKNKKIARAFIDFASSKKGQKIMKKYGFVR